MTSQEALPVEVRIEAAGVAVVRLRGEHDLSSQPTVARALAEASEQPLVLVDFSDCSFIDSSVIEALVRAHDGARARGSSLEAVIPPEAGVVGRMARLVQLELLVPVRESPDVALAGSHGIS